jgi:hypothetical protein
MGVDRAMDVGIVTLSTRAVGLDTPRQQMDALKHYKDLADSI